MWGAWFAAALVGAVEIVAGGTCPSDADVAERLRALVPETAGPREIARLSSEKNGLLVELADASGAPLAQRWLHAAPCADLAQAAAVVIAAWEAELRSHAAAEVKLPAAPPPRHAGFEVGAAFVASLANGSDFAPGGALDVAIGEKRSHFLGRLELAGFGTRNIDFGNSQRTSWTRAWIALGPMFRFRPSRFVLDVHLEGLLALLYFHGVGFNMATGGYDADVGFGGGVRGAVRVGVVRFFLGASVAGWVRGQQVTVTGGSTKPVPPVELLLSAGLSFGND